MDWTTRRPGFSYYLINPAKIANFPTERDFASPYCWLLHLTLYLHFCPKYLGNVHPHLSGRPLNFEILSPAKPAQTQACHHFGDF